MTTKNNRNRMNHHAAANQVQHFTGRGAIALFAVSALNKAVIRYDPSLALEIDLMRNQKPKVELSRAP